MSALAMIDHARGTDPVSSDRTVKSILVDATLAQMILDYAQHHAARSPSGVAFFNDTELWRAIEERCGRRRQRNVIARARGRLVDDGLLIARGQYQFEDVELEHYSLPEVQEQLALEFADNRGGK